MLVDRLATLYVWCVPLIVGGAFGTLIYFAVTSETESPTAEAETANFECAEHQGVQSVDVRLLICKDGTVVPW